jgi:hypothetical protein
MKEHGDFDTKKETGQQKKLHNQELHDFRSSLNIVLGGRDENRIQDFSWKASLEEPS